jgi:hypothetical protein
MPDRPRRRMLGSTYLPTISPPETIRNSWISVPDHITTAGVTLHLTVKYSNIFQELYTISVVTE